MFRRKKKKRKPIPDWLVWISERTHGPAIRLSRYLQAKLAKTPPRWVRVILILLLAGLLGTNVVILLKAVNGAPPVSIPDPVRLPRGILPPRHRRSPPGFYLDSLLKDSATRRTYDSLLKARPGLADTIRHLQNLNR
jgi:hypothetical protein